MFKNNNQTFYAAALFLSKILRQDMAQLYSFLHTVDSSTKGQPEDFRKFVHAQLKLYNQRQRLANRGLKFVPKKYKPAFLTIIDVYIRIAKQIEKNPHDIYSKKLGPSKPRIILTAVVHLFD